MRKNLGFLLLVSALSSFAQYINIPDAHFRDTLQKLYPSCFNTSGQLNTTCKEILYETELHLVNASISNLEGIQYFKNLQYLNCSFNHLKQLPDLPKTLKELHCVSNNLKILHNLPSGLTYLDDRSNPLTQPSALPNKVLNTPEQNVIQQGLVYPNPAQDLLYFNTNAAGATYKIFDAIGTLKLQYTGHEKSVNIAQLTPGIYFIKIHDDAGDVLQKFTKE